MCQSKVNGGKRCASHTRGAYCKALAQAIAHRGKQNTLGPLALATERYASTDEGYERIRSDMLHAGQRKDYELDRILTDAWIKGAEALPADAKNRPQGEPPPWPASW